MPYVQSVAGREGGGGGSLDLEILSVHHNSLHRADPYGALVSHMEHTYICNIQHIKYNIIHMVKNCFINCSTIHI